MALPERGGLVVGLLEGFVLGVMGFAEGDGIWIWMAGMFGRVWRVEV